MSQVGIVKQQKLFGNFDLILGLFLRGWAMGKEKTQHVECNGGGMRRTFFPPNGGYVSLLVVVNH
jgi:hypothetical protein